MQLNLLKYFHVLLFYTKYKIKLKDLRQMLNIEQVKFLAEVFAY